MSSCVQCGRELDASEVAAVDKICKSCLKKDDGATMRSPQDEFIVSNILIAINVAIYFWMVVSHASLPVLLHHYSAWSPSNDQLIRWGANTGPLTLSTQPWRLFTCLFLHISPVHLLANMWALFVLGRLAESMFGRWNYLLTYLISGLAGSVASLLWNPVGVSAGASGAIFGIAGALITTLYVGKLPIARHSQRIVLATLIFWAGFDLLYGIWKQGVDNAAHIGGFAVGLAIGLLLGHHLGPDPRARLFRERLFIGSALVIVLFAAFVWHRNSYVVELQRAALMINSGAIDDGLRQLQMAAARRPNEPSILLLTGDAYLRKGDLPRAEQAYRRVTQLKPDNLGAWELLAQTLTKEQKLPDAVAAWTELANRTKGTPAALAWFNAGQIYIHMDKPEEAIKAYQRALSLSPDLPEIWAHIGYVQLRQNQNEQAIASLERAVKLRPNDPDYRLLLGNAYMTEGKESQAQEQFFQASKLRTAIQERIKQLQEHGAPAPK